MFDIEVFNCLGIFDMTVLDCSGIFDKVVFDCLGRSEVELFENWSFFSDLVDLVSSNSDLVLVLSDFELVDMILVDPSSSFDSFDSISEKKTLIYPARARSARARRACALRALGLLLADGAPPECDISSRDFSVSRLFSIF